MKLFELSTGLIAAVMIALGASYYVNKHATIEEESVVEILTQTEAWFEYTGPDFGLPGYNPHDPENYTLFEDEILEEPTCSSGLQVCAIRTRVDMITDPSKPLPNSEDLDDLEDDIDQNNDGTNLKFKPEPVN